MIMVPEMFGPYEVQEPIGRGGMGEVHRAFDTVRQRTVALKRLRPEFAADERFRTRFLRECRLAAQLTEAHVIPIHDFGEIDSRLYLDMRLVHGSNLEEVLATGGPLTPDRAVGVVTQVAAALDAAHAAGLVHRDVKPSNVLLSTDGPGLHCYLADFGVAAAVGGSGSLTSTGTTVGTMAYIAPERLRGEPADHRVDVYSLACLLHEALTGQPPFRSDELAAVIRAHLELEPPQASSLVPTVPPALDEVVVRGMAKDPALRHQTAGELAAAANAALSGRMIGPPAAPATVAAAVPDAAVTADPRHAPRTPAAARRRRGRLVPRLALVGLLLLAIAVVTIGTRMLTSVEATQVQAEPASSPGGDPFAPADTRASPSAAAPRRRPLRAGRHGAAPVGTAPRPPGSGAEHGWDTVIGGRDPGRGAARRARLDDPGLRRHRGALRRHGLADLRSRPDGHLAGGAPRSRGGLGARAGHRPQSDPAVPDEPYPGGPPRRHGDHQPWLPQRPGDRLPVRAPGRHRGARGRARRPPCALCLRQPSAAARRAAPPAVPGGGLADAAERAGHRGAARAHRHPALRPRERAGRRRAGGGAAGGEQRCRGPTGAT